MNHNYDAEHSISRKCSSHNWKLVPFDRPLPKAPPAPISQSLVPTVLSVSACWPSLDPACEWAHTVFVFSVWLTAFRIKPPRSTHTVPTSRPSFRHGWATGRCRKQTPVHHIYFTPSSAGRPLGCVLAAVTNAAMRPWTWGYRYLFNIPF